MLIVSRNKIKTKLLFFTVFLFVFVLGVLKTNGIAEAVIYYVGPGQTYTTFADFHSYITPAPGDIIDGGGNTFHEQVTVNASGNDTEGYITYRNFKIDGSNLPIDSGIITYDGVHHTFLKFVNIEVYNINHPGGNSDQGIYLTAASPTDDTHNQVIDCTIHNIAVNYLSTGIRAKGAHNLVDNCLIYDIGGDGIYASGPHFTLTNSRIYNVGIDYDYHAADCVQCGESCTDVYIAYNDLNVSNGHKNNKQCIIVSDSGGSDSGLIEYNTLTGYRGLGRENDWLCNVIYINGHFTVRYNTIKEGTNGIWVTINSIAEIYYNYINNIDRSGITVALDSQASIYNNTIQNILGDDNGNGQCVYVGNDAIADIKNNICNLSNKYGLTYWGSNGVTADYNSFYNCANNDYSNPTQLQGEHDYHQTSPQINTKGLLIAGSNLIGAGAVLSIHQSAPNWIADYNGHLVKELPPDIGMATYLPFPTISDSSPSGILPKGTEETTLSVITDENATCRYETSPNIDYNSMTHTFTNTGGTTHTTTINGLNDGQTYQYYIRCQDNNNNTNPDDYIITFSVNSSSHRTDVNNDSQTNSTDALLTLRNSLGLDMSQTSWQESSTTGDANCDGTTNSTDALLILRYSLGLDMNGTGWCGG